MIELNKPQDWQYLHFFSRITASVVDMILQGIMLVPLIVIFYPEMLNQKEPSLELQVVALLVQLALLAAFWLSTQSTPGKMIFHARIVDANTGGKPSAGQFALRFLGYILCALPLGLGFISVAFDKRHQGWHDKMARTVVIQLKKD